MARRPTLQAHLSAMIGADIEIEAGALKGS
jgi:hypothetical protein